MRPARSEVSAYLRTLAGPGVIVLDTAPILADERGVVREASSRDLLQRTEAGYQALNAALKAAQELSIKCAEGNRRLPKK